MTSEQTVSTKAVLGNISKGVIELTLYFSFNIPKFLQGNAEELLPKMIKDGEVFDSIVVDPPRTGLNEKFIKALLESNVKRIIYVSCNPETLKRDLYLFSENDYIVQSITGVDMFPRTVSIETVCLLNRKKD